MKNVIVTGASRGIGRGIAVKLAREGYRVLVNYNHSEEKAKETIKNIKNLGGEAVEYRADVSSSEETEKMVRFFHEKYGEIYGLVLNAGIYIRKNIWEMSVEEWDKTLKVNLYGSLYVVKAALPYMNEGAIVFIASQLAFRGSKSSVAYGASKAGVLGLMRSLAVQLAPKIRVNAVSPGTIDTDIIKNYTQEQREKREKEIPMGRIGKPEDVANAVAFLMSEEANYITGANIDVNGGLYIH